MKTRTMFAALMSVICSVSGAYAQQANPEGRTNALPRANTENRITYVCGGIGKDEADKMKQAAHDYDLMLTFATKKGAYLSDAQVVIDDTRGHPLLSTTCDGPIMLVDLPKVGRYHVRSEMEGQATSGTAVLGRGTKGKPLHLVVPAEQSRSG